MSSTASALQPANVNRPITLLLTHPLEVTSTLNAVENNGQWEGMISTAGGLVNSQDIFPLSFELMHGDNGGLLSLQYDVTCKISTGSHGNNHLIIAQVGNTQQ